MKSLVPIVAALALAAPVYTGAEIVLGTEGEMVPIDLKAHRHLSESDARFERVPNTWTWVADVEHVVEKERREEIFLADSDPAYYFYGDTIPAGRDFELFPYHYYDEWEVEQLGGRIKYRLLAANRGDEPLTLDIKGIGTIANWDNFITWRDALSGKGARTLTLEPGEEITLWYEEDLKGGLPWSAIVLGRADRDLYVAAYAWLGDEDPGMDHAEQMPDLSWAPYLLASFSRGSVDWNAATIDLFPHERNEDGALPLSQIPDGPRSINFGYSPGGPPTNLCYYQAVAPTFVHDLVRVNDPVSGTNHLFFGGNYPIMYRFTLPLLNDTSETRTFEMLLCSNDIFGVDTFAGVWIEGQFMNRRVPLWKRNEHWRVFEVTLAPGETKEIPFTVVPLGSRWGGMIATFQQRVADPES